MGDLTGIFIVGFIVLGIYKLFELFVKKRERIMMMEKFSFLYENKELPDTIRISPVFSNQSSVSWPLRISLLLIGVGLGCLFAFFTQYALFDINDNNWKARELEAVVMFSFIAIFGGLGLLAAYLIEAKKERKNSKQK
jgi:hypothetical protein